ncbi:DUF4390 domain-containing protein [Gemmatimonadota bacterium]
MIRPAAILALTLALLGPPGSTAEAQEEEPLRLSILPETGAAVLEIGDIISAPSLLGAVEQGLPLRIRVLVQLWRDGIFDNQESWHEWRASMVYDPLTRRYQVQGLAEQSGLEEVNTLEEARGILERTLDVPLRPGRVGRYYYMAEVEMETLSLSDLEELQRWLQGELGPVVSGETDVEGALGRGFRRLLVRMLNLPADRFTARSPSFEAGGGGFP